MRKSWETATYTKRTCCQIYDQTLITITYTELKHQILPGHVSSYIPIVVVRKSLGLCSRGPSTRTPLWPSGASNRGIGGKRCRETWPLDFSGCVDRDEPIAPKTAHMIWSIPISIGRPVVHQTMSCKQVTPIEEVPKLQRFCWNSHCHINPLNPGFGMGGPPVEEISYEIDLYIYI